MKRLVVFAVASVLCAPLPALSTVVTFSFTGTIADQILQSGFLQSEPIAGDQSWLGQTVSGLISLDLGAAHQGLHTSTYNQYSKTQDFPDATWANVEVHNPDGSTIHIPSGVAPSPFPQAEGEDAYTEIQNGDLDFGGVSTGAQDTWYMQRTRSNSVSYPQERFSLSLRDIGQSDLVDGVDYATVHVNPSLADWDNVGRVSYYQGAGNGYAYSFLVNSLQVASVTGGPVMPVPEPLDYLFWSAGGIAGLIAWRRRGGRSLLPLAMA